MVARTSALHLLVHNLERWILEHNERSAGGFILVSKKADIHATDQLQLRFACANSPGEVVAPNELGAQSRLLLLPDRRKLQQQIALQCDNTANNAGNESNELKQKIRLHEKHFGTQQLYDAHVIGIGVLPCNSHDNGSKSVCNGAGRTNQLGTPHCHTFLLTAVGSSGPVVIYSLAARVSFA